jgi:UDP:flavonoid glycosyltransferase YjiC (YdhE family)
MLFPLTPTRAFPTFVFGRGLDRGAWGNRLFWQVTDQVVWQLIHRDDSRLRRELGLRPLPFWGPGQRQEREGMPVLYAYSPTVLPRPADWPARIQVTGYWFLDPPPGWQPPADLERFLAAGPPPVSFGLGSMVGRDAAATLRLVLRALALCRQRGVLLAGWSGLGQGGSLPESVFAAQSVPHSWLFGRVAAVVHHGGAGTTGAALRAGVPSVTTPLAADQPSWARRIHELGAGPAPIPFGTLTTERLAAAIREAVTSAALRERAAALGRQIRAEDGLGRAVALFETHVARCGRVVES